jgi:hypothetical protein
MLNYAADGEINDLCFMPLTTGLRFQLTGYLDVRTVYLY